MDQPETQNRQLNHSVLHAVRILELYAAQGEEFLSLTQISRLLSLHKTTVYRILRTLQSVGWIEQSAASGQYRLGSGVMLAAGAAASRRTSRDLILEEMKRLAETFNETVVLCAVRGETGICVELVKSSHTLSMQTAAGYVVPFHAGASGKTLLAAQTDDTAARLLARCPEPERAALYRQVRQIRSDGYCCTESEADQGAAAVSVPLIVDRERYALSISGPLERLRGLGYPELCLALKEAAGRIERKNAARGPQ